MPIVREWISSKYLSVFINSPSGVVICAVFNSSIGALNRIYLVFPPIVADVAEDAGINCINALLALYSAIL